MTRSVRKNFLSGSPIHVFVRMCVMDPRKNFCVSFREFSSRDPRDDLKHGTEHQREREEGKAASLFSSHRIFIKMGSGSHQSRLGRPSSGRERPRRRSYVLIHRLPSLSSAKVIFSTTRRPSVLGLGFRFGSRGKKKKKKIDPLKWVRERKVRAATHSTSL